ncbi:MAG: hypothetical protein ACOZCO_01585 [Bacteroidota bacterium]
MKTILIILSFSFFHPSFSQVWIGGLTADHSSSLQTPNTFAVGLHREARLNHSNWYLNWHLSVGTNTQSDFYGRATVAILAYGIPGYWRYPSHTSSNASVGGILAYYAILLVAPIACPSGVSNYCFNSKNGKWRAGFYLNPLQMDYWDYSAGPIQSWTIDGGLKVMRKLSDEKAFLLNIGGMRISNMLSSKYAFSNNRILFNVSFGMMNLKEIHPLSN